MDKYLLQILLDVNTIIIPGLGALTVTNAKTGEMMFMSYLKYDDGKLAAYISEKEGMSENDAKNLVAKYVREIHAKLDQGQTYDMFKFGRFLKNKEGDVDFESWGSYSQEEANGIEDTTVENQVAEEEVETQIPAPESVTPEEKPEVAFAADEPEIHTESSSVPEFVATANDPDENKDDDVIEDLTVMPVSSPSLDEILEKAEERTPEPAEDPKPELAPEPVAEPTSGPVVETTPIADQTPDESRVQVENIYIPPGETPEPAPAAEPPKPAPDLDKGKDKKPPMPPVEPKPRKKRSAGFWILVAVLALLVIGGASTLLFYDKVKQYLPFLESKRTEAEQKKDSVTAEELNESAEALEEAENERITSENQPEEMPAVEEQPAAEAPQPVEVAQPAPAVASADGSKPYHVIAGAFASEENADKYAAKNNFTVLGKYDGMYLVSSSAHDTRSEAQSAMNGKGWIFKKR